MGVVIQVDRPLSGHFLGHDSLKFPMPTWHTNSAEIRDDFCLHFCVWPNKEEIFWVPDHSAMHYGTQVDAKPAALFLFEFWAGSAQRSKLAGIFPDHSSILWGTTWCKLAEEAGCNGIAERSAWWSRQHIADCRRSTCEHRSECLPKISFMKIQYSKIGKNPDHLPSQTVQIRDIQPVYGDIWGQCFSISTCGMTLQSILFHFNMLMYINP